MKYLFSILLFLSSVTGFAHGENKPGPHGGFIRMPGAYHTEVIKHEGGYQIYLLDIQFTNPITINSSVVATIFRNGKKINLQCLKHSDHFYCLDSSQKDNGELRLDTVRDGAKGVEAVYPLPLQLTTH